MHSAEFRSGLKLATPLRSVLIVALCLFLAGGLALQSASIALSRKAPSRAATLFPANGLAKENMASALFQASNVETSAKPFVSEDAEKWARTSYLSEPLSPESIAILALSLQPEDWRTEFVNQAVRVNRRNTMLQGLVLQEYILANDYEKTIETLDEILRVRPSRSAELFPVLIAVFSQEGAVSEFAKVLDGSSPWHRQFVSFALNYRTALPNLSRLRAKIPFEQDYQDQLLIRNLAKAGDLAEAFRLYDEIGAAKRSTNGRQSLSWASTYAPFEWQFADSASFRAQRSIGSEKLEIYIRSGEGGTFASRVVKAPAAPFSISLRHDIAGDSAHEDMNLKVACTPNGTSVGKSNFDSVGARLKVPSLPQDCKFLQVTLSGRAWTGRPPVRGDIFPLEITY